MSRSGAQQSSDLVMNKGCLLVDSSGSRSQADVGNPPMGFAAPARPRNGMSAAGP
jgi:hypothetical protein